MESPRDRAHVVLFVMLLTCSGPLLAGAETASWNAMARSVTIRRDTWGVPHIYGPTDASVAFGYLYAQAEDNFWQVEENYLLATGRSAEVHGERALAGDLLVRALEIPRLSREEYARARPKIKEICDAAAAGLNYFVAHNPDVKPRLIKRFEPWHIFAFTRYAVYVRFVSGKTGLRIRELRDALREVKPDDPAQKQGSNMWAIDASRSASGHAMLFINPHQPFFGPGQFYEGHVVSEEGLNITGASFFGSTFPSLGHNEHLGWSHTVNNPDIADVYAETFDDPANPLAYRYGKETRTATRWTETLAVKRQPTEAPRTTTYEFTRTHHGPVLAIRDGKPLTLRLAKFEAGGQLDQWYAMGRARSLAEFKRAMSRLAIPMFNTMYADRDGNIFYVYNAAVPRRSLEYDWRKPVDGSDPATEWQGYHSMDELPQLTNPASGFLQNCNQTPFTTTSNGNPHKEDFPRYMTHENDNARARISRKILSRKKKFTFDDWARAGFDTTILLAEDGVARIVAGWEKLRQSDGKRAAKLAPVIAELKAWDGVSRVDSRAMTLFVLWTEALGRDQALERARAPEVAIGALEGVVGQLLKLHGTWEVPWGEMSRLQRIHTSGEGGFSDERPSLPVAGGPGWLGIVFNFYPRPQKGLKRFYGVAGHSFVSVVEFAPQVRARSVLVFGQNAAASSPHHIDQARLYARGEFKPAWFRPEEIRAHTTRTYHPGE